MESTLPLYQYFFILSVAIGILVWSADCFVSGASGIAGNLNLSPLIIGLTVVSFGTSAPEIMVSASAAMAATPSLAVGNALGSNLANMGLVLALTALIFPLTISAKLARTEMLIMVFATAVAGAVLWDGFLGRYESLLLVACLVAFLVYLYKTASSHSLDTELDSYKTPWPKAIALCFGGLMLLLVSSNTLVWSASIIAAEFGISDLVIGITVVAVGTSLPELAASVAGALRGKSDMVLGNIIGSNIFNLTAVLPVAGIIHPAVITETGVWQDFGFVFGLSLFLSLLCLYKTRNGNDSSLGKIAAAIMLVIYVGYYGILFS